MDYNPENYLLLSGIQHFCFCRRQWALIHIENCWEENMLTAEGRVIHDRVHDSEVETKRNEIVTLRGIRIKSDRLHITGVCDAVELRPDDNGIELSGRKGLWRICPVEYKHGESKSNDCDRLQVAAQSVCLEEMFCCEIEEAFLYYHKTRHREKVEITNELRTELADMADEMWNYYTRKYTPKVKYSKRCDNCSLIDSCLPKVSSRNVQEYIREYLSEVNS